MRSRNRAGLPLFVAALLAAAPSAAAQAPGPSTADAVDTSDIFMLLGWRKATAAQPVPFDWMTLAIPTIGVNPSVGVSIGAGASTAILLGDLADTTVSSATASLSFTSKQQILFSVRSVVLTSHNDWELIGDWRLYDYAEPTYGLGTAWPTPVSGGFVVGDLATAALPGEQPLQFRWLRLHETVFHRVYGVAYAGVGYHLDRYAGIVDESLDLEATPPAVTSHYGYSLMTGFDAGDYTLSGVSLEVLHESRDHTLDPQRGTYLRLAWQVNPTWLGSSRKSSMFQAEYRTYVGVSARRRHLVAFWVLANGVTSGDLPYLTLPALGYDTRGRSGRGYAAGHFRGKDLLYGEVEYRFPLSRSGVFGGVVFANAVTASRPELDDPALGFHIPKSSLFDELRPAAGAGLRIMADRKARMNLAIDLGFGQGGSKGLYLALGEAF